MYREILNQLAEWKDKSARKPLLLAGARGVGKSYALKDFGDGFFTNTAVFDFKLQEYVKYLFAEEVDKELILKKLSISCGESIIPGETLLVFENVDALDNCVDILRFICDEMSEFHVAYTLMQEETSFLAKNIVIKYKTEVIFLYPMSFSEFLIINKESAFCDKITNQAKEPLNDEEQQKLDKYLSLYMITGGMPSVLRTYVETMSLNQVEAEKAKILFAMNEEIDKVENVAFRNKIKQVVESIPVQLEKDNKKFQYGAVKLTARAREYKDAVDWLIQHKYVMPLYRAKQPTTPLSSQKDDKSFELFVVDVGLLASMFGLTYKDMEEASSPFDLKNGALTEQYIYEELMHNPNVTDIYYWISEATARIEFMFQDGDAVIPIEVNLDCNEKAQSLKVFKTRYQIPMAIRVTRGTMGMEAGLLSLPLFSLWNL